MTRHCMLDLETLGKRSGCVILSIGACVFTRDGVVPGSSFHCYLDLTAQVAAGLDLDPETVLWWLMQSDDARSAQCQNPRLPLGCALLNFKDWFHDQGAQTVWSNGADFDIPIFAALFRAISVQVPWKYNAGRCVRTIMGLVGKKLGDFGTPNVLAHDALADAHFQAGEVAAAMRWLIRQQRDAAEARHLLTAGAESQ